MDVTERLLKHITSVNYEDLPPEVVVAGKRSVMDTLGVLLAGASRPGAKEIAGLVKEWGGKAESTVLVYGGMVPAHEAVLANSTMARALDFDDLHMRAGVHPSATIVPVALATAELRGKVSGKELITALVLGIDTTIRLRQVPDFCLAVSGWVGEVHSTFGAAATAGKILGFPQEEMSHALGIAYSQAASTVQPFFDGALVTRVQQGFAARSGLLAAVLAGRGITGAKNFLEGKAGFYPVYYRGINYDINRLVDGIGERYEVLNLAIKPYPSCGFTHAAIENVIEIMQQNQLSAEDIDEVLLRVNQRMYTNVCQPVEARYRPQTVVDAMFSLPYTVGTAMLRGDVFLDDFTDEAIKDSERLKMTDKVKIVVDEDIDQESIKLNLPLSLHVAEIKTKSGKSFSQKMLYVKGYPQKPMTLEDCALKLRRCIPFAAKSFSEGRVNQLIEMVKDLEQLEDVTSLIKLLS